jgi:hypothetical protein
VEFDENNGSQVEQVVQNVVGDADSSQVIRSMGIGNILPMESCQVQAIPNEDLSSTHVAPPSSTHDEHSTQDEASNQEQPSSPQSNEQDQGEEQVLPHSNDQAQVDSRAIGEAQTEFIGYDG